MDCHRLRRAVMLHREVLAALPSPLMWPKTHVRGLFSCDFKWISYDFMPSRRLKKAICKAYSQGPDRAVQREVHRESPWRDVCV